MFLIYISTEPETPQKSEKVLKWIEAVETAPTLSRLHVLLAMFEKCVKWEKSAANARCKICRKKDGDTKLLLCDECNQPFHMYCLRPALSVVPKGEWKCPACAVSVTSWAANSPDPAGDALKICHFGHTNWTPSLIGEIFHLMCYM